ncbi:hypothetical protein CPB86DRAFT_825333 [Serendipita vermifera]|nr:hypothetical protein CPB86DRAFT_825333 [Serendipita vermifera]
MATSSSPSKQAKKGTKRLLFQRADGRPYDFWIQTDLDSFVREHLLETIPKYGGRVCGAKDFPKHGFFLIDAMDPGPVHAIKGSFNRPTKQVHHEFLLVTRAVTPLRHVLSYRFIDAVISQGSWDHHDIRQWGFPVELAQTAKTPAAALKEFKRTVKRGEDEELEKAWVVKTGSAFDSYNDRKLVELEPAFRKLLDQVEKDLPDETPEQKQIPRNYVRGRLLVDARADWRVRFHIHESVNKERRQALVKCIMENGGTTCHDADEATVILIGCEVDKIDGDMELERFMEKSLESPKGKGFQLKFDSWVDTCIREGFWRNLSAFEHDVIHAYKEYQERRAELSRAKGKSRVQEADSQSPQSHKRKRSTSGEPEIIEISSSPVKKRKLQNGSSSMKTPVPVPKISGGSALRSNRSKLTEPGSASTIKPTRIFSHVEVPRMESPLKFSGDLSSLTLTSRTAPNQPPAELNDTEDEDKEPEIVIPRDSPLPTVEPNFPVFDPQRTSRVSGVSGFTNSTTRSKMTNITTITAASNARSVGPAPPPNPKQIPRPSTSTVATEFSGASRGPVDNPPVRRSMGMKRTDSLPASYVDDDDLEGEKILSQFPVHDERDVFAPVASAVPNSQDELWGSYGGTFIEWVHQGVDDMAHYGYQEGIEGISDILYRWHERRDQYTHSPKGKGRVSFHEGDMGDKDAENAAIPEEREVSPVSQRSLPPLHKTRSANRLNHSSRTPSSVEGSDLDTADESVVHETDNDVTAKPRHYGKRQQSTPRVAQTRSASKSSKTPVNANVSNSRMAKRPNSGHQVATPPSVKTAPARSVSNTPNHLSNAKVVAEETEDDETRDEVAPLPARTTRSKTTRSKPATKDMSDGEVVPLRRGRSASVAPSDAGTEVTVSTKGASTAQKTKRTNSKAAKGKQPKRK